MSKKPFVRSSLGNRHSAAPPEQNPAPALEPKEVSAPAPVESKPTKAAPAATAEAATATPGTTASPSTEAKKRYPPAAGHRRFGFYLHAGTYGEVKSAYVADRLRRGDEGPDTIAGWITEAIDRYNALQVTARHEVTEQMGPEQNRQGAAATRQFVIATRSIEEAGAQVLAEAQAGLPLRTRSRYLTDALRAAVERVRAEVGTLPPAPERVPNTFH